jgi:hypothetical protein
MRPRFAGSRSTPPHAARSTPPPAAGEPPAAPHLEAPRLEALEPRALLSAPPQVTNIQLSDPQVYPGRLLTISVRATDDAGPVPVVTIFLDRDLNGVYRRDGNDQTLGEVYFPRSGTTDWFDLTVRVDDSWPALSNIVADAMDTDRQWTPDGGRAVAASVAMKPMVTRFTATPDGADLVLTTVVGAGLPGISSQGFAGVTFFLDQNNNGGWDAGTDIDLGAARDVLTGPGFLYFEKRITPQAGWDTSRIGASAFDNRASSDRFGPVTIAVPRASSADIPVIQVLQVTSQLGTLHYPDLRPGSDYTILARAAAAQQVRAVAFFIDNNLNGLWDWTVDEKLGERLIGPGTVEEFTFTNRLRSDYVPGRVIHVAAVAQDRSSRGNDAWGPVQIAPARVVLEAWVEQPTPQQTTVPRGQSYTIDVIVRDDRAVKDVRVLFSRLGGGVTFALEYPQIQRLQYGFANVWWRITIPTTDPGFNNGPQWRVGLQARDFEVTPGPWTWTDLTLT